MVVKCPSCGQQVRGEPGQSGPCPKCRTQFVFPEGDSRIGELVTCPHCGQRQTYVTGRCVSCGKPLSGEYPSKGTYNSGVGYRCPHCGNVQNGDTNICRKCGKSMLQRPMFLSILWKIILIISIIVIVLFGPPLVGFLIRGQLHYDIAILVGSGSFLIPSIIFLLISVLLSKYCKNHSKMVEANGSTRSDDRGGFLWGLLGFLIPIIGLIIFLLWVDTRPRAARAAAKGALICVLIPATILVMFLIWNIAFYFIAWLTSII